MIGYGRIGREVVRLLAPWGMRVLVTQRTPVVEESDARRPRRPCSRRPTSSSSPAPSRARPVGSSTTRRLRLDESRPPSRERRAWRDRRPASARRGAPRRSARRRRTRRRRPGAVAGRRSAAQAAERDRRAALARVHRPTLPRLRRVGACAALLESPPARVPSDLANPGGARQPAVYREARAVRRDPDRGGAYDPRPESLAAARNRCTARRLSPPAGRAGNRSSSTASTCATCGSATPSSSGGSTWPFATSTGTPFPASSRPSRSTSATTRSEVAFERPPCPARGRLRLARDDHRRRERPRRVRLRRARRGRASVQPDRDLRPSPVAGDGGRALSRPDSGRRARRRVPRPDRGAARSTDGAYHALFPAFDRLEVELPGRRAAAARVRGRPVGDGGPPQLDGRELQDVLDADRTRPARAARGGAGARASASDHSASTCPAGARPRRPRCG